MNFRYSKSVFFLFFALATFVFGIWLRLDGISSKALEYDEIWTLESYAGAANKVIFTDLALPNNHPLNSLLIKYSMMMTGAENLSAGIRLNAFIAGSLTVLLAGLGAYLISGKTAAVFFAVLFAALNGGLIHYSQTGRGYSLQTFLITAFAVGLIYYRQHCKHWRAIPRCIMSLLPALAAVLSILTLSTSVLFLFPVCCIYLIVSAKDNVINLNKKSCPDKYILSCFLLTGGFALYWYLSNFSQFRQGQGFGSAISGVQQFLNFAIPVLTALTDWKLLVIIVAGLFIKPLRGWIIMAAAVAGFVLASALIFKAGPARAYLPLIPLFCIAAGCAVTELGKLITEKAGRKVEYAFFALAGLIPVLSLSASLDFWTPPDWKVVYNKIKDLPLNYFTVYPLNESYPLWFNNKPAVIKDIYSRATNISENSFFVSISNNAAVQGKRADGSQLWIKPRADSIIIDPGYKDLQGNMYRLKRPRPDAGAGGKTIVAHIAIQDRQDANVLRDFLWEDRQNEWLLLNEWLNCPFSRNGKQFITYVMISDKNQYSPSDLKILEERTPGRIHFFYLDKPE